METARRSTVFPPSEETVHAVRALHGLDAPGRMDEAVRILDTWIKQQPHFRKKDFHPRYLENTIIYCKGSIEQAKARIDKYCSVKSEAPDFFQKFNAKTDYDEMHKLAYVAICPKFIGDYEILTITKLLNAIPPTTELYKDAFIYNINMTEYAKRFLCLNGGHLIIDYFDVSMSEVLMKMSLLDIHRTVVLCLEAQGLRLKGVHLISGSKLVDTLVSLLKPMLSKKLSERIHVHKNYDTLHNFFPKEVLPSTYGGTEKSMDELNEILMEKLSSEEHIANLIAMQEARTDERYRPIDINNEDSVQGTFRSLNID